MKKIILCTLVLISSMFAGQNLGKPVFLLLWSDTCPHCQAFITGTMKDKRIKELLRNFDVEAINVNEQKNVPYDIDFTGVVPSIHILNQQKSQLVNTVTGDIPAEALAPFLVKFLEMYDEYKRSL